MNSGNVKHIQNTKVNVQYYTPAAQRERTHLKNKLVISKCNFTKKKLYGLNKVLDLPETSCNIMKKKS